MGFNYIFRTDTVTGESFSYEPWSNSETKDQICCDNQMLRQTTGGSYVDRERQTVSEPFCSTFSKTFCVTCGNPLTNQSPKPETLRKQLQEETNKWIENVL